MSELKIVETVAAFRKVRSDWAIARVGFVPTMGALHDGHASLIRRAKKDCAFTAVSIFVNPTQFNNPQDLKTYPQPLAEDLEILRQLEVDAVLLPSAAELYEDAYRFIVHEDKFSRELCGAHRPGHFDGVLSVVLKLFNIVQPNRAYFGEKDFQQLSLIQDMAKALFLPLEVVPCPTLRDADGLAMSSRNKLLSSEQRQIAPTLYRVLTSAPTAQVAIKQLNAAGFKVDYVEDRGVRRFAAAALGSVRLIDNVQL